MIRKLVFRDIRYQILKKPWKIVLALLPVIILLIRKVYLIVDLEEYTSVGQITGGDLYISLFYGINTYLPESGLAFAIPYEWMLVMLILTLFSANLVSKEMECNKSIILLVSRSRRKWVLSRYISAMLMTTGIYLLYVFLCLLMAMMIDGKMSLFPTKYIEDVLGMKREQFTIISVFGMPLCTILCLVSFEVTIETVSNSIIGYLTVIILEVMSCYYTSIWVPGNGILLVRSSLQEMAIAAGPCIAVSCFYTAIMIVTGCVLFVRKDIK